MKVRNGLHILALFSIVFALKMKLNESFEKKLVEVNLDIPSTTKTIAKNVEKAKKSESLKVENVEAVDISDVEGLTDFYDNSTVAQAQNDVGKKEKVEFTTIKKKIELPAVEALEEVVLIDSNKRTITELQQELSYKEIQVKPKNIEIHMERIAWSKLSIDSENYNHIERNQKMEVASVRISKPETSTDRNNNKEPNESEELVFFDYSKIEKVTDEDLESPHLEEQETQDESPEIASVISKKAGISPLNLVSKSIKPTPKTEIVNLVPAKTTQKVKTAIGTDRDAHSDYLKTAMAAQREAASEPASKASRSEDGKRSNGFLVSDTDEQVSGCLSQNVMEEEVKGEYSISVSSVNGHSNRDLTNFQVRFQDNLDDIKEDFGTGVVKFDYSISTKMNARRGLVLSSNHYPTATDIVIDGRINKADIPLFTRKYFERILDKYALRGFGAHILVELDDRTEDLDLDIKNKYEKKFYLNKSFKIVNRGDSDYLYVLYIGVDPGNIKMNFRDIDNNIISKIIHGVEGEIYFEPNMYKEANRERVEFYNEGLLSNCKSFLNISPEKIRSWNNSHYRVSKETLNKVTLKNMKYSMGARKYLELNHLEEKIYMGFWGNNKLEVPEEDYIEHALSYFDTRGGECVVQLNLTKKVKDYYITGISKNQGIRTNVKMLDSDGKFYDEIGEQTKRIFILGEEQGIFNILLEYVDGSTQYLNSLCSTNTYFVEQL